jgi:hypothetical protein
MRPNPLKGHCLDARGFLVCSLTCTFSLGEKEQERIEFRMRKARGNALNFQAIGVGRPHSHSFQCIGDLLRFRPASGYKIKNGTWYTERKDNTLTRIIERNAARLLMATFACRSTSFFIFTSLSIKHLFRKTVFYNRITVRICT